MCVCASPAVLLKMAEEEPPLAEKVRQQQRLARLEWLKHHGLEFHGESIAAGLCTAAQCALLATSCEHLPPVFNGVDDVSPSPPMGMVGAPSLLRDPVV